MRVTWPFRPCSSPSRQSTPRRRSRARRWLRISPFSTVHSSPSTVKRSRPQSGAITSSGTRERSAEGSKVPARKVAGREARVPSAREARDPT